MNPTRETLEVRALDGSLLHTIVMSQNGKPREVQVEGDGYLAKGEWAFTVDDLKSILVSRVERDYGDRAEVQYLPA